MCIESLLRSRGTGYSSVCIYVKNMYEVRRLIPTISEIFMKMKGPLKYSASASIIARESNRVAQSSCAFQVFNQNQ